jgi:hypothetical protein
MNVNHEIMEINHIQNLVANFKSILRPCNLFPFMFSQTF